MNPFSELKKTKLLFWKTDPVPDKCSFPESNIISFRRVRIIILDNLSEKNYSRRKGTEYAESLLKQYPLFSCPIETECCFQAGQSF